MLPLQVHVHFFFVLQHSTVDANAPCLHRPLLDVQLLGDRIYVLVGDGRELEIVNRYTEEVATRIELPAPASDLRVDPLGRYLLVRAAAGDSAFVVDVGTNRLAGSVGTRWLVDLPFVAPDGSYLIERVASGEMPPPSRGRSQKLPDNEINILRRWITEGSA